MPLAKEIMAGGFSAGSADAMAGQVKNTISAAGTLQSDATALTASVNLVTTVGASSGVILLNAEVGDSQKVYNGGANALKVYPPTSGTINNLSANAAATVATNTLCEFHKVTTTQWVAQLSA